MLKRKYRLPFYCRFTAASNTHTNLFVIKVQPNDIGYNRYGFIVSKRVDKRAVVRNTTKRKLRSCIEDLFEQIQQGYDILFILKKSLVDIKKEEVCSVVRGA